MEEEVVRQIPNFAVSQDVYRYESGNDESTATQDAIIEKIRADNMLPYYEYLLTTKFPHWTPDEALITSMRTSNEEELGRLNGALEEAEKNAGDMEIMDALFARASFYCRIGAKADAYAQLDAIIERKKISPGKKLDAAMDRTRLGLFFSDIDGVKQSIQIAKKFIADAGDWDRRNRMRVYEAMFAIMQRDIKTAAKMLLEGVATFTCTEICSYTQYIVYVVVTNLLYLPRSELRKKIIVNPQVIALARRTPFLPELMKTFYDCEYDKFFAALLGIHPTLSADRYFGPHMAYITREYRVLAYTQFLEAYRSVTLSAMARAFGVDTTFLDRELSRFISVNRLSAKIDKVGEIVETVRADKKNAQYSDVIKQGDLLLNNVQKLARVLEA